MNYERAELLERLAGEYVLGTLQGAARRRFERLCARSTLARDALHRWEDEWSLLSRQLAPVQPAARVWANVRSELFGELSPPARSPRARRWRTWQLAAAAGVAALALIAVMLLRQLTPPTLQTLAVLGADRAHPLWRLERSPPLRALTIEVVGTVPLVAGRSYELWALPQGGAPVSLGLLPETGRSEHALTGPQRAALLASDKVAVSIEPAGGSPTGSPTGPIVIVTSVRAAG